MEKVIRNYAHLGNNSYRFSWTCQVQISGQVCDTIDEYHQVEVTLIQIRKWVVIPIHFMVLLMQCVNRAIS